MNHLVDFPLWQRPEGRQANRSDFFDGANTMEFITPICFCFHYTQVFFIPLDVLANLLDTEREAFQPRVAGPRRRIPYITVSIQFWACAIRSLTR